MSMTRRRLLDDTFKKTVEGNPAIATDSLARMYPGIEMNGWTTQDGTPTPEAPVPIVSAGTQNQETGKWEYGVELSCGNLFNKSTANENKYIDNDSGIEYDGSDIYASDYINVFGFDNIRCTNTMINQWMAFYNHEKIFISGVNGYGEAIPVPQNAMYARFTIENSFINTFSVNAGSTLLPYTPYRPPQTVTLTADRPLTKWDKLEKRNGQWGWVYKSDEKVLDGTENYMVGAGSYISELSSGCYTNITNMLRGTQTGLMNRLSKKSYIWVTPDEIGFSININQLHVRISNSDLGTTGESSASEVVDAMKAYMAHQYEEGNPFVLYYETTEETFVPLSESEQEAMDALYTFRPTTVLSNDAGCEMKLTYKTRKGMN